MNPLFTFRRKIELRDKRKYNADELADMLGISYSYFTKLNGGFLPISDRLKIKMKKLLASEK